MPTGLSKSIPMSISIYGLSYEQLVNDGVFHETELPFDC